MFKTPPFFIYILVFLLSCSNTTGDKSNTENKVQTPINEVPLADSTASLKSPPDSNLIQPKVADAPITSTNNIYNNITAVISGYKGKANNLNYLFDSSAWKNHAKFIDSSWKKLERKRLIAMQTWGRKEFENANNKSKLVFYPFSGPDYLTAHAFFPDADKYIMLGLEPVGKLPDLKKFKPGDHSSYSQDLRKSLGDIFSKSYFITRKMLQDFQSKKVNGLLPVLAFFIKRSGHEILDVKYLMRYYQDSIVEVDYGHTEKERKPFGVRIDFLQNGKVKSLYYFKYDVSNKLFNDTCVFKKYLHTNTQNCITYIKSASYLLHNHFMSNMKDLILKNSTAIIQDDTGMPYKYIQDENKFDIKLYGVYIKPVTDFPWLSLQKPLQEAFHKDSAKIEKIPFHLGYHWQSKKDILIYALKK
ncbi:MAG: hypothetical protein IPM51_03730 [Sphingobacteriaceae bacterium]|nr:hypothetical protein [Sphingobacteriaceae bacterium]